MNFLTNFYYGFTRVPTMTIAMLCVIYLTVSFGSIFIGPLVTIWTAMLTAHLGSAARHAW